MSITIIALQRNETCYCGAHKKYKVCCLRKDEEFRDKYHSENVIIFHDMAFTDERISDKVYNDGRISMKDDSDIEAIVKMQRYFHDTEVYDPQINNQYLQELQMLIDKNQHDPCLYNLLYNIYAVLGEHEKAASTLHQTLTKFPAYFYGKAVVARGCLYNKDFDGIFEAFNRSYTLRQLYPHREVFHVEESRTFHFFMAIYSLIRDFGNTRFHSSIFRKLNELGGYDKNPDSLTREFDSIFDSFFGAIMNPRGLENESDNLHHGEDCNCAATQ